MVRHVGGETDGTVQEKIMEQKPPMGRSRHLTQLI
jgi:hypothetical protein